MRRSPHRLPLIPGSEVPYIEPDLRRRLDAGAIATNVGELTYQITSIVCKYRETGGEMHFADHAEIIAALECAKLEYYRRVVEPYENVKIVANGDVF